MLSSGSTPSNTPSQTTGATPGNTPSQTSAPVLDRLSSGQMLKVTYTGSSQANKSNSNEPFIESPNGQYRLYLQSDGNVVIYNTSNWSSIWSTRTNSGVKFILQSDGNIVLYNQNNNPVWNSGTQGLTGTKLILQNDSNLVLYNNDSKTTSYWSSIGGKRTSNWWQWHRKL